MHAQEPRSGGEGSDLEATIGNSVLQMRYLATAPINDMKIDLDYGCLLSEKRDVIARAH